MAWWPFILLALIASLYSLGFRLVIVWPSRGEKISTIDQNSSQEEGHSSMDLICADVKSFKAKYIASQADLESQKSDILTKLDNINIQIADYD